MKVFVIKMLKLWAARWCAFGINRAFCHMALMFSLHTLHQLASIKMCSLENAKTILSETTNDVTCERDPRKRENFCDTFHNFFIHFHNVKTIGRTTDLEGDTCNNKRNCGQLMNENSANFTTFEH